MPPTCQLAERQPDAIGSAHRFIVRLGSGFLQDLQRNAHQLAIGDVAHGFLRTAHIKVETAVSSAAKASVMGASTIIMVHLLIREGSLCSHSVPTLEALIRRV